MIGSGPILAFVRDERGEVIKDLGRDRLGRLWLGTPEGVVPWQGRFETPLDSKGRTLVEDFLEGELVKSRIEMREPPRRGWVTYEEQMQRRNPVGQIPASLTADGRFSRGPK